MVGLFISLINRTGDVPVLFLFVSNFNPPLKKGGLKGIYLSTEYPKTQKQLVCESQLVVVFVIAKERSDCGDLLRLPSLLARITIF